MKEFILQEKLNDYWLDLYCSDSYLSIKRFFNAFLLKYPDKKFRIIEVRYG